MKKQEKTTPTTTFSVRPRQAILPHLRRIAAELGRSEAQVLMDIFEDVFVMLETEENHIPQTVRVLRLLRKHNATYASPSTPIVDASPGAMHDPAT